MERDARLEVMRRDVARTVENFRGLQEQKLRLVESVAHAGTAEEREGLLEQLHYQLRLEERYVRLLQASAHATLDAVRQQRDVLAEVPGEELRRPLMLLFDRIAGVVTDVQGILVSMEDKVGEEQQHVGKSEGRGWFSSRFDATAYRRFLDAWAAERGIEERLKVLRTTMEGLAADLQRTQDALDARRPLVATVAVGAGVLGLLSAGFAVLGILGAFIGLAFLDDYVTKERFLERWRLANEGMRGPKRL